MIGAEMDMLNLVVDICSIYIVDIHDIENKYSATP